MNFLRFLFFLDSYLLQLPIVAVNSFFNFFTPILQSGRTNPKRYTQVILDYSYNFNLDITIYRDRDILLILLTLTNCVAILPLHSTSIFTKS